MSGRIMIAALSLVLVAELGAADSKDEAIELVKRLSDGTAPERERDAAERALRKMGATAIPALRDAKPVNEESKSRVRNTLTDVACEAAKFTSEDAALVHAIAREEGNGKRYTNAERLYRRAGQLYDKLSDDADGRKEREKVSEYRSKRELCTRMCDQASRKVDGRADSRIDLGFIRVVRADKWE